MHHGTILPHCIFKVPPRNRCAVTPCHPLHPTHATQAGARVRKLRWMFEQIESPDAATSQLAGSHCSRPTCRARLQQLILLSPSFLSFDVSFASMATTTSVVCCANVSELPKQTSNPTLLADEIRHDDPRTRRPVAVNSAAADTSVTIFPVTPAYRMSIPCTPYHGIAGPKTQCATSIPKSGPPGFTEGNHESLTRVQTAWRAP